MLLDVDDPTLLDLTEQHDPMLMDFSGS